MRRTPARRLHATLTVATMTVAAVVFAPTLGGGVASAATYHVSPSGSDGSPGTTARPWRSLARVRSAALRPGDRVLLRRGGVWKEQLVLDRGGVSGRPIVIGAYGAGPRPLLTQSDCIKIKGSFVIVQALATDNCTRAGVTVQGDYVAVRNIKVTRNIAGIEVDESSHGARITRNFVLNNNRMNRNTQGGGDDHGAFGILLHGDNTRVDHNVITGSDAPSYDYGRDGAAIEIYGARRNVIHANLAVDNLAFAELGDSRSVGNVFISNVVQSRLATSAFLITRGGGGYGPVRGTQVINNTVAMTGAQGQGFVCMDGCSGSVLRLRNNIIQARWKVGYVDGSVDEDYNLFSGGKAQFRVGAHSIRANPRFVSVARGNLRLLRGSPALDRGVRGLVARDIRGRRVPQPSGPGRVARPDLGAYERSIAGP